MSQYQRAPRSNAESMFMAMPILLALALMSAVGLLAFLVWWGGTASGERVQISFECSCPQEASVIMSERIEALGLGDVQLTENSSGLVLLATLPDMDGALEAIPKLLARPGKLLVKSVDGEILADGERLESISLSINESGMPYVGATFDQKGIESMQNYVASSSEGFLDFWVDQQLIAHRPNTVKIESELPIRIVPEQGDTRHRLQLAADVGILLSSAPYPCQLIPSPAVQLY